MSVLPGSDHPLQPAWAKWRSALTAATLFFALALGQVLGAGLQGQALQEAQRSASAEAALLAATLRINLEQYRDVPAILAVDPGVLSAAAGPRRAAAVPALSARFEALSTETRARAIYLIGQDGITRSASNWRTATSFVGQDYRFRPYFRNAMRDGSAEFFALGTVSAAPGLYIARRLASEGEGLGVVVVKVQFEELEAEWATSGRGVLVTDPRGVVLLASHPEWRFRTTRAMSDSEVAEIIESRQFGDNPTLELLPIALAGEAVAASGAVVGRAAVSNSGWTLWVTSPVQAASREALWTGRAIGGLVALLLGLGAGVLIARRERSAQQRRRDEEVRALLERGVQERTSDLSVANARLSDEVAERQRAENNAQILQDELVQANRLAILGQISAGVAHEINQPLAAIRSFSENATTFLDRNDAPAARDNMITVTSLCDRIALITDELRSMSRRGSGAREEVLIADALKGALLLVGARLRNEGVHLNVKGGETNTKVLAHKMRLEQVVINLLQNAIDAAVGSPRPEIVLSILPMGETVVLQVEDNGPGLDAAARATLFTPFHTSKPQGLGLGLVISQDICREYGGVISVVDSRLGGAGFAIHLPVVP